MMTLDSFGFGNGRAQADGKVIREMIPADGHRPGVADHSAAVGEAPCSTHVVMSLGNLIESKDFPYRRIDDPFAYQPIIRARLFIVAAV